MIQIDLSKYSENGVYTDIGYSFERYVVDLLKKCGWDAYKTQSTGDFGADVIAEKDGIKYAVQCKYGSADIGNKALYEAVAGRDYYKCDKAACITNCDYTNSAKEYAKKTGVILWNQYDLQKFIKQAETPIYTEEYISKPSEMYDFDKGSTALEYHVLTRINILKANEREMCQAYNLRRTYQSGGDYETFDNMTNYYRNENYELVNKGNALKKWYASENADRVRDAIEQLDKYIEDDWGYYENEKGYLKNFKDIYAKIADCVIIDTFGSKEKYAQVLKHQKEKEQDLQKHIGIMESYEEKLAYMLGLCERYEYLLKNKQNDLEIDDLRNEIDTWCYPNLAFLNIELKLLFSEYVKELKKCNKLEWLNDYRDKYTKIYEVFKEIHFITHPTDVAVINAQTLVLEKANNNSKVVYSKTNEKLKAICSFVSIGLVCTVVVWLVGKYIAISENTPDLSILTAFGTIIDIVTWIVLIIRSRIKKEDKLKRAIIHRVCFLILCFCVSYLGHYPIG